MSSGVFVLCEMYLQMASLRQIITQTQLLSGSVAEALAAVNRTVAVGLKGHLASITTVCTSCVKHLASGGLTTACLELLTALTASLGLMLETLLSVEFLLTGRKNEFLSAIFADQSLVFVHWD